MRKEQHYTIHTIVAVGIMTATALVSCSRGMNAFDDSAYNTTQSEKYQTGWTEQFGPTDPQQNWNMATRTKATVTIQEDALAEYIIMVYESNPLTNVNAALLRKVEVKTNAAGYAASTFDLDVPKGEKILYVARMDSHNRRVFKTAEVTADGLSAAFGYTSTEQAKTRGLTSGEIPTMTSPYSLTEVNEMLSSGRNINDGMVPNMYWIEGTNKLQDGATLGGIGYWSDTYTAVLTSELTVGQSSLNMTNVWRKDTNATDYIGNLLGTGKRVRLVVGNGGILKFANNPDILGIDIIIADGGKVQFDNQATLKANTRIVIMPGGELTSNSLIDFTTGELIYNNGTLTTTRLNINFGPVYNGSNGVINATDRIMLASSTETTVLTNFGHITTKRITGDKDYQQAGTDCQGTVNNMCNITATEEFTVNYLNLGANSEISTELMSFQGGVTLRENSILRSKRLRMNLTDIKYVGASTGAALISTNKVEYVNVGDGAHHMSGNIWFEADEYGSTDEEKANFANTILETATAGNLLGVSKVGEANISIAGDADGCIAIGNTPSTPEPPQDTPGLWIIACEDLGSTDDYDFNDIVISVAYEPGSTTATVTPLAAGGTLEAHVYWGEEDLGEIHEWLGYSKGDNGIYPMINTGGTTTGSGTPRTLNVGSNFSLADNMGGINIVVTNQLQTIRISGPQAGKAPQMFLVKGSWRWPKEKVKIQAAYPDFGKWNGDASNIDWCKNPANGIIWN